MPSPQARCVNRNALGFYREDLSLEQIAIFEYMVDIARFSTNGIFRIKYKTLQQTLRINRYKLQTLLTWLKDTELLKEKPRKSKNEIRCYFMDFSRIVKKPELIFSQGIPHSPEYSWMIKTSYPRRKMEIIKRKKYA